MRDMEEKTFIEGIENKNMEDPLEILNWYRNLYYKETSGTERSVMAWAINDLFSRYKKELGL